MWILAVFPPLWTPIAVSKPRRCPFCGTSEAYIYTHQYHQHEIDRVAPGTGVYGHTFELTRFRCKNRRCRKTFMPPFPTARSGLLDCVRFEIFALYCFGFSPEEIQQALLEGSAFEVKRSVIYRTLRPSNQDQIYSNLKQHHRALRRRRRRPLSDGERRDTYCGRWERDPIASLAGAEAKQPARTITYDQGRVTAEAASHSVRLFNLYGDRIALDAVRWLGSFFEDANEKLETEDRAYLFKAKHY